MDSGADTTFHLMLGLVQFLSHLLDLEKSEVRMRHRVGSDDVTILRETFHLLPVHHQTSGVGWHLRVQIEFCLLDLAFEIGTGEFAIPITRAQVSAIAFFWGS